MEQDNNYLVNDENIWFRREILYRFLTEYDTPVPQN
jgi:hypothetical protein